MVTESIKPLSVAALYRHCDDAALQFQTTDELPDLTDFAGQKRALDALRFGMRMQQSGYNVFVLGPPGIGKHTIATRILEQHAADLAAPQDWVYVNNFDQPHRPVILQLPAGDGQRLARDMEKLVIELQSAIPAAFESDEYRTQVQEIEQAFKAQQEKLFDNIRAEAEQQNIVLLRTAAGFAFAPARKNEAMSPPDFEKLPKEEQHSIEQKIETLQEKLRRGIQQVPQWRSKSREQVQTLNKDVAQNAVGFLLEALRKSYAELPKVLIYLKAVEQDVVENFDDFRDHEGEDGPLANAFGVHSSPMQRYDVNVLVDHSAKAGAPVVYEDHPTYSNLVGRIEHVAMMGALITDFRLIKPGALHRANGGYLLLDAHKVLQHAFAWDGLKRILRSSEVRIQSLEQMLSLGSTVSLEPEPMPLNVKVVLLGERILYYLLYQLDPDFPELFKVAADFDDAVDRIPEQAQLYARLIATLARQHKLKPLEKAAVARVIEQCSRWISDSEKLTAHMRSITDLICEANYWALESNRDRITRDDIERANVARDERRGRLRQLHLETIKRGTLLIDTRGARIGVINGLSVVGVGDVDFGVPVRISAVVRLGEGDVVDIEREVELGGPLHSKGVMILSSFLGARYAHNRPLSLSASLVFEQSYGEVEGDSASSTELYALLSAIGGLPVKQGYAVTGSINQHGEIQAIGGVNEKIEGFFDVCRTQGLSGEQGVLIPAANVKNLMLRQDVIAAVEAGQFAIYAVKTVDEGVAILTGTPAGERDAEGKFPPGSVNFKVEARLLELAESRHEFGAPIKDEEEGHESNEHGYA